MFFAVLYIVTTRIALSPVSFCARLSVPPANVRALYCIVHASHGKATHHHTCPTHRVRAALACLRAVRCPRSRYWRLRCPRRLVWRPPCPRRRASRLRAVRCAQRTGVRNAHHVFAGVRTATAAWALQRFRETCGKRGARITHATRTTRACIFPDVCVTDTASTEPISISI
jgi:hypothetical protein